MERKFWGTNVEPKYTTNKKHFSSLNLHLLLVILFFKIQKFNTYSKLITEMYKAGLVSCHLNLKNPSTSRDKAYK